MFGRASQLARTLGIAAPQTVALLLVPPEVDALLGELPRGVTVQRKASGKVPLDLVLVFAKKREDLDLIMGAIRPRMAAAGALWVAWPDRASTVPTDLDADVLRELGRSYGLVDDQTCTIADRWDALRLVIQR